MKTGSTYSCTFRYIFERFNPCRDKLILFRLRNKKWTWWGREILTCLFVSKVEGHWTQFPCLAPTLEPVVTLWIPMMFLSVSLALYSLDGVWETSKQSLEIWFTQPGGQVTDFWTKPYKKSNFLDSQWQRGLYYFTKAADNPNTVKSKLQQRKQEHS